MKKKLFSFFITVCVVLSSLIIPEVEVRAAGPSISDTSYKNPNITPVRDQGAYGLCWAFSTIAACEAELVQNNGQSSSLDLSELHLGFFASNRSEDPLGNISACQNQLQGLDTWYNRGNNQYAAMNLLASWGGLVDETTLPYSTSLTTIDTMSVTALQDLEYNHNLFHLENTYIVDADDRNSVKKAILDYGGVSFGFNANAGYMELSSCYDSTYHSLYNPNPMQTDHEALIVGWDDNFNNFAFQPQTPGAWIAKNSWGTSHNDAGYFYISYCDKTISNKMFAYDMEPANNFDNIYQYESDISGSINAEDPGDYTAENAYKCTPKNQYSNIAANVFEANANPSGCETLEAISFVSYAKDARYRIRIYTNLNDDSDPMSGKLEDTLSGEFKYSGYRTIDTTHPIELREGTKYSVVVEVMDNSGKQLGVATSNSDMGIDNKAKPQNSFYGNISSTGVYWYDLNRFSGSCMQIKAFTKNKAVVGPTGLDIDKDEIYLSSSSLGEWITPIITPTTASNAKVTWTSSDTTVAKVTAGGKVLPVGTGQATITAEVLNGTYSKSCLVYVEQAPNKPTLAVDVDRNNFKNFHWNADPSADGYNIYTCLTEQGQYVKSGTITNPAGATAATVIRKNPENLSEGYRYCVYIKSFKLVNGHEIESERSDKLWYAEPVSNPQNFRVVKKTANSITVKWDAVTAATGYEVRCYEKSIFQKLQGTEYTFTGLDADTNYSFVLTAWGQLYDGRPDIGSEWISIDCRTEKEASHEHDFSKYVSLGNGRHKVVCKDCDTVWEGHSNDACSGGTATCTAKAKCSKCKAQYGALKAHTSKTTTTKATLSANGKKVTSCTSCGTIIKTSVIYAIKTIKLSAVEYTYDGKAKKPAVTVKDSKGNVISASYYSIIYPDGLKNVGKYTVKVTLKGNYSGSKSLSFVINPPKTSISSISAKSKSFDVKWAKKTSQVTGYEIQYSTSKTFASGNKTVKVTSAKTVSKTIKSLKAKKTYYVRIRTYKTASGKTYYSAWSAVKSVTTKK